MDKKLAPGRETDPLAVLKPGSTENGSPQLKTVGSGPIKPTAIQNASKRKMNVKLPAY